MAKITERTEITRRNLEELIQDPQVRNQMEALLKVTDRLSMRVFLLPSGERFDIDNGVLIGPSVTHDIPLTKEAIYSAQEVCGLLVSSLFQHSAEQTTLVANAGLDDMYRLVQRREYRRAVTEKYFTKAGEYPCTMEDLAKLMAWASEAEDHLEVYNIDPSGPLQVSYRNRMGKFPFDPLMEPAISTAKDKPETLLMQIPRDWRLLVALVLHSRDEPK